MIIPLIQALYDSNMPLPKETEYYEHAIEDIEFFSISSQIYWLLKQQNSLHQTPEFFQERLKQKYQEALYQSIFIKNQLEQVLSKFEDIGIEVIPLKGVLFAEKYFGHLGARWTSDIDLLIKPSQFEQAIACVKELGFTLEGAPIPFHFHCNFSKEIPGSPVPLTIELHWDLLRKNTSDLQV